MSKKPINQVEEYIDFLNIVSKRLESHNQILTLNKSMILEILFENSEHLSAEDIIELSKYKKDCLLKTTTVYRALSAFEALGIVHSILVNDKKRYETNFKEHHDHLICVKCNSIIEFINSKVEKEQEKIAKQQGFKLLTHTMYLYGVCKDCQ
jgi:Fur family ferric uptake transcriptional regulator